MGMCCPGLTGYATTQPDCYPSPSPGFSTRVLGSSTFSIQPDKDLATSTQGSQSGLPTRLLLSPRAARLLGTNRLWAAALQQQWVWPWLLPVEWPESCLYPDAQHPSHFRNRSGFLQMNPLGSAVDLGRNFRSGVTSFRILVPTPGGLSPLEETHTRA